MEAEQNGGERMPKRKLPKEQCFFGRNINLFRTRLGLTQQQVADAVGVSRTTYTKWETGASEPSFTYLSKLVSFFDARMVEKIDYNSMFSNENFTAKA